MRKSFYIFSILAFMVAAGWHAQADTVSLMAATANPNTKPEVRLRWVVTDGWLAPGGYNLYRIVNGQRTKVNTQPIQMKPNAIKPQMLQILSRRVQLPNGQLPQQGFFQKALARDTSHISRDAFTAYGTLLKQQSALTAPQMWQSRVQKTPAVVVPQALLTYRTRMLRMPNRQLNPQPLPPGQKLPPDTETVLRRQHLFLTGLTNPQVADAIGMAYTDPNVQNGQQITYALRAIGDNGQESPNDVATATITVGKDPQPPAPEVEKPIQTGVYSVALHWSDPPEDVMKALVTATYSVFRIDKAHPQGVQLNKLPIMVSYQNDPNNQQRVSSLITFSDEDAPIEPLSYRVVLVDSFGRESQPTTVQIAMEDWRTPPPVTNAQANLSADGKSIDVIWNKSADNAAVYRIFRIDTEQPNAAPQLLTPQPINGIPYVPADSDISAAHTLVLVASNGKLVGKTVKEPMAKVLRAGVPLAQGQNRFLMSARTSWKELASRGVDIAPLQQAAQDTVLVFTDTTIAPDHYYLYLITADYKANLRDSTPAATNVVAVPLKDVPPGPANLKASFTKTAQTAEMQLRSQYLCDPKAIGLEPPNFRILHPGNTGTKQLPQTLMQLSAVKVARPGGPVSIINLNDFSDAIPADIGGNVTLSWAPVNTTKGMRYRIYRASLTGYFRPNVQEAAPAGPPPPPGSQTITFKGGIVPLQHPLPLATQLASKPFRYVRTNSNIVGANGVILAKYVRILQTPIEWKLLGETDQTQYTDPMPRSRATYYLYRVVAVTRWDIASTQPSELRFRVPSTLPPTTPILQKVVANEEGNVVLSVVPNPPNEEVAKFLVYRQEVPPTINIPTAAGELTSILHNAGLVAQAGNPVPPRPPVGQIAPAKPFITTKPFITATPAAAATTTSAATHIQNLNVRLQQVHASAAFAGRNLIANDQTAQLAFAASSRFGVRQQQSPALALSSILTGQQLIKAPDPAVLKLLDLKNYTEIGEVDVPQGTTDPVAFVDSTAKPEVTYEYCVVAVDQDDNHSIPSNPLDGSAFKVKADPPQNVSVSYDATLRAAKLSWAAPATGAGGYVVFRAIQPTGGGQPNYIQLAVLPGNGGNPPTNFTDYNVRSGPTYLYIVRAIDQSGNISAPPQQPISFKVP